MKKAYVRLTDQDRETLRSMLDKSSLKSRAFKKIVALQELDKGQSYATVESLVHFSRVSLRKLAKGYAERGLDCLYNRPRPGRPIKIQDEQRD